MRSPSVHLALLLLLGSISGELRSSLLIAADDPLAGLRSFSAFSSVDLRRLEAGEVLGEPGSQMVFPNGISTETCFAVFVPAAEAARRLQIWDPSLRGTLKTLQFHLVNKSCTAADFQNLRLDPANRAQRWLIDKSLATTSSKSELNLTRDEAQRLAVLARTKPGPEGISAYWSKVLLDRTTQFQHEGFAGLAPYEMAGQPISPLVHLRALMAERETIAREFAPLLKQCGMIEEADKSALEPFHYWALYEANRHATLTLGAVYLLSVGERFQLLDVQYYVNGTYYTFATLYEVWPIELGQKPAALVWRGDFFSAPRLAYARGVERLAYAAVMLQELKDSIRSFQKEVLNATSELPLKTTP
jgi:hypothetical protein